MSRKLKDRVQFPKWMFVPSLMDCVTAKRSVKFDSNQNRIKKKTEKKLVWITDYMRRLHFCFTSCGGIQRIFSTLGLMWSWVCEEPSRYYRTQLEANFFLLKRRLHSRVGWKCLFFHQVSNFTNAWWIFLDTS